MRRISILILALAVMGLCFAHVADAGNKKLMTIKMAKQDLKRNIMESIVGYKVRSSGQYGLTEDAKYKVETKANAVIKGVQTDECVYDKGKDVAICYGHVDLGTVQNVLGDYNVYKDVTIYSMGLGTMTESSKPALQALRAAMLNAYDEMATVLVGEKISSSSQMDNFVLTKDKNRSKMCAAVYGAHIPQHSVKFGKKGWGWDEEGDAYVILQIDVEKVKDILGNTLRYKGENIIEVMGMGAMKDELAEAQEEGGAIRGGGTKVRYDDLAVPTSGPKDSAKDEYKGGAEGN